jgi:pimeloyl-ACP methyl ester carboxylesterase
MKPELLLLPGLTCDAEVWRHQTHALADCATTLVPAWALRDDLGAMAEHALSLATQDPVWVAGHSMGGRVALEMWRLAPQRIAGLALLDTGYQAMPPGRAGEAERRNRHNLLRVAERDGMRAMAEQWACGMVYKPHQDGPVFEAILAMLERAGPAQYAAQIQALMQRPDATDLLPTITCPTLLLCGEHDGWSPPERHVDMAHAIGGHAQCITIAHSGHMSPMEQPQAVSAALRDWLAGASAQ